MAFLEKSLSLAALGSHLPADAQPRETPSRRVLARILTRPTAAAGGGDTPSSVPKRARAHNPPSRIRQDDAGGLMGGDGVFLDP